MSDTAVRAAISLLSGGAAALKRQLEMAQELEAGSETENYFPQRSSGRLVEIVRRRMELVSRIRAGEFNALAPIVFIRTRHPVGCDLVLGEGESIQISWGRHALRHAPADAAALVGVPGWYPYWEALPPGQKPG